MLDNGEYTEFLSNRGVQEHGRYCWGSNFGIDADDPRAALIEDPLVIEVPVAD